ncbi:MAG: TetR/AcrR family transcriptional regulator [Actinobacteria bacterium]|nr:TetR/AcrR family transcriptional regulator [Actinomycetota bacterium]MCB9388854.1 TetR/AcrR family transcriptional regulator [Acidimicrobiia bacterium]
MIERRRQEVRTAQTQQALCQATIECLVEYGYAGTTTRMVADRAGVSRGAQTHHYPTKHELVVAAIEQLFADQAQVFINAFEMVPQEERTFRRAIDELWNIVSGPAYAATLEVIVAGRTDDELRAVVHGVAVGLERTVLDLFMWFAPEIDDPEVARRVADVALTLVQGAAVSRYGGFGNPDEVIELVRLLANPAVTAIAALSASTPTHASQTRSARSAIAPDPQPGQSPARPAGRAAEVPPASETT